MKRALVTGGAGFLGSAIVKLLLQRGVSVRVLAQPDEPTDHLASFDIELLRGNVLDVDICMRGARGVDTIFHTAAIYRSFMPDPRVMYEVNLRGTFNILEAARRAGVERCVYTASIVSLGRGGPERLADETTPYEAWGVDMHYSRSKYHSREVAEGFAQWGQDIRVVCPGVVLGPGDIAPTPSGKLILNTLKLRGPAVYTSGGTSYVDVRDAAEVHLLAAERGRPGERYIATAHNLDNGSFIRAVLSAAGRPPQARRLPAALVRPMLRGLEQLAISRGKEPPIASSFFEFSLTPGFYSNQKSILELGASYRSFDETLKDAIEYFKQRGLLT